MLTTRTPQSAFSFALGLALFASVVSAQDRKFAARDFLIPNYENLIVVDLKAMRDCDVWEDLEVSVMKLTFRALERKLGFKLTWLDRLTVAMKAAPSDESGGMDARNEEFVRVLEGNVPLPVHESITGGSWQREDVGDVRVWRRSGYRDQLFAQPTDKMQVSGTTKTLLPAIEKKRVALPSAEVMSMLSGREQKIAYFVVGLDHPRMKEQFLTKLLGGADWPADDHPRVIGVKVLVTGDLDDSHLTIEAVLRHKKAGDGIAVSDGVADAFLKKLIADPEYRLMKPLLKKVEKKIDGTDLVLRMDLGRVRNAVGHLAVLCIPLFMGVGADAEAIAAPPRAVPAPVQPKAKPAPQKNNGVKKPKGGAQAGGGGR